MLEDINTRIRCEKKALRVALDPIAIDRYSKQIAQHLVASKVYKAAQHIAYYLPVRGEADAQLITHRAKGKTFYLPIVKEETENHLLFAPVNNATKYSKNKFGILEPITTKFLSSLEQLDLVVTPLVSYDQKGSRLGMGGGFYDRTFSYKQRQKKGKPLLIGYAYSFQESTNIQIQVWDVALDGIVTEKGFSLF
ncbi:MAG: 5-formyltetrahydrofolate cyclo-ligase [Thiotrichaceae bacterium]|nr:5-formyltetrahydrofolate cyclo-ligase [Thiotrichaceae bacterium]